MRAGFLLCLVSLTTLAAGALARSADVQWQARAGFDSNPIGAGGPSVAAHGEEDSLVYGGGLTVAVPISGGKLTYAGDVTEFSDKSSENFDSHRLTVAWSRVVGAWRLSADGSTLFIDGRRDTLATDAAANANALSIWRERRRQWQHRLKLVAAREAGPWVARTSGSLLDYDYGTRAVAGFVPFADRSEVSGGVDVGWRPHTASLVFIGGRLGRQNQDQVPLPNCAFDYSNNYRRVIVGFEAKPSSTSSFTLSAGPSFHHYTGDIDPRSFLGGRDRTALWLEGAFTFQPISRLTVAGKLARMPWLSSTGKSAYLDTCAETLVTWSASAKTSVRASAKIHRCDYFPTTRDDFEAFLGAGLTRKLTKEMSLTADLIRHNGWNALSSVQGRSFHRLMIVFGLTVQL